MSSERIRVAVRFRTFLGSDEERSGLAWRISPQNGIEELFDSGLPCSNMHEFSSPSSSTASPQSPQSPLFLRKNKSNASPIVNGVTSRAGHHTKYVNPISLNLRPNVDGVPQAKAGPTQFVYDHTFGDNTTTKKIYDDAVRYIIEGALDGFNGTIFAYGQTGSGKTFTMIGTPESPGIVVLALNDIFRDFTSQRRHASKTFLIRCSFLEIYNETINDLLNHSKKNLKLQDTGTEINVVGLTCLQVTSVDDALNLMEDGLKGRATASTNMNEHSSRSHSIFTIYVETLDKKSGSVKQAQLNLVDLAGSESAKRSGASGKRLQEGKAINSSLLCLGNAISILSKISEKGAALASTPRNGRKYASKSSTMGSTTPRRRNIHIPYRNSKLTHLLKTSLGGNARTALIATISPARLNRTESKNTLRFALKAMLIQNRIKVNEVTDDKSRIKQMEREIQELKHKLATQSASPPSSPAREKLRRAKMAAIAQTRRQKDRWNSAVSVMKERNTIMKKFSQFTSTLKLKGQVVKEKVTARRKSAYYQGLLNETEKSKETTADNLQTEIDELRMQLRKVREEKESEVMKHRKEKKILLDRIANVNRRLKEAELSCSKFRQLIAFCRDNNIIIPKNLELCTDNLHNYGASAYNVTSYRESNCFDDNEHQSSGLPLSPASKAAVHSGRQVVNNIRIAMEQAVSHQNATMQRLLQAVNTVDALDIEAEFNDVSMRHSE